MTTTTLAVGAYLGESEVADAWYGYINNGEYSPDGQGRIVNALIAAQRESVEERLPAGCRWDLTTAEIIGPVGADPGDLAALLDESRAAIAARFEEIEAAALECPNVCERCRRAVSGDHFDDDSGLCDTCKGYYASSVVL